MIQNKEKTFKNDQKLGKTSSFELTELKLKEF